jgi:hypothetical protein
LPGFWHQHPASNMQQLTIITIFRAQTQVQSKDEEQATTKQ